MSFRRNLAALLIGLAAWLAAAIGSLQAPAQSKSPAPEAKKADPRAPGDVDVARSRVYVLVGKKGRLGHEHGVVGKLKSGRVTLGASTDAGEMEFDMASFVADTKEARRHMGLTGETDASTQKQVTDNMLSANVLNVKKHSTSTFVIKSVQRMKAKAAGEAPRFRLDGEFTLYGKSKPLAFEAVAEDYEGQTRLRGNFTILQSDFGIRPYSTGFGTVGVADELKIWGDVLLKK